VGGLCYSASRAYCDTLVADRGFLGKSANSNRKNASLGRSIAVVPEVSVKPDFERNAAFYNEVAARYDAHMHRKASDALARRAFIDLVSDHVSSGSTLLDFGCGTGLDASDYLRRGYRVLAYDHSPGMIAQLKERCKTEIASGDIKACSVNYSSFVERFPFSVIPQAVVSNFAVLNLIRDLEPLFDMFARHLAPPGWLIISIWNPIHWTRLLTPHWWSSALRKCTGAPVYRTRPYMSYLHFVPALLRAAPQFRLLGRANAGALVRYHATSDITPRRWWDDSISTGGLFRRLAWHTVAHKMLGHFVFLVLRRDL
jgi:SAM-dependent methyltransferase